MARSKKSDGKQDDSASLQISIEDFIRTRDSVVTGLATLQSAVQDLSRAYIAHTNTVIGKAPNTSLELLSLTNPLGGDIFGARAATPGPTPNVDGGETKKRKRAPHDKNAPKRPVTPYFLYMQTARPQIAAEMEPSHTAKEVADEGTKRWNDMAPEEREMWSYRYAVNFARYKEKVKAYKAGLPIPEISDAEAKKLYDEQQKIGIVHIPPPDHLGHTEIIDTDTSDADDDTSSSDETPEPPRAPSPPKVSRSSKRRHVTEKNFTPFQQATDQNPMLFKQVALHPAPTVEERVPKSSEKEKKKKNTRKSEGKDLGESVETKLVAPAEQNFTSQDTPMKPKKSKKKRKSEALEA